MDNHLTPPNNFTSRSIQHKTDWTWILGPHSSHSIGSCPHHSHFCTHFTTMIHDSRILEGRTPSSSPHIRFLAELVVLHGDPYTTVSTIILPPSGSPSGSSTSRAILLHLVGRSLPQRRPVFRDRLTYAWWSCWRRSSRDRLALVPTYLAWPFSHASFSCSQKSFLDSCTP